MQKSLILSGLLIMAALTSCEFKEELKPAEERIFRGVLEQLEPGASTRAYATKKETGYEIFWNRDDRLSIFYDKTYNREYRVKDRDGSQAAEFERVGTDPEHISEYAITTGYDYAIYPYHEDNRCFTDGTLTVVIPATQTVYDDARGVGVRPIMVAQDPDGDFMFMHAATYIGISLKGAGVSVSSISFQGNNSELLAGYPLVTFKDGEPDIAFDENDTDNSSIVSLQVNPAVELDADNAKTFWLTLMPGTLKNGFTLTVTDANGGVFQRVVSSRVDLERKVFNTIKTTVSMNTATTYSLVISPTSSEINVGESQAYTLTLTTTTNGTDATSTVTTTDWSISDSAVATIANGTAYGTKEGEVTITARYTPEGSSEVLSATATLKVNKEPNNAGDPTPGENDTF